VVVVLGPAHAAGQRVLVGVGGRELLGELTEEAQQVDAVSTSSADILR
jgi:hypothetical protein